MFVADISLTDLQRVSELRVILEGFCARLAAQRVTRDQLAGMEAVVQQFGQVSDGDSRALMAIDARFHKLLYQAANNEFLAETLARLHALSFRLWCLVLDRLGGAGRVMEQHTDITEALKARDAARAETLIQQHVSEFQQCIKEVV